MAFVVALAVGLAFGAGDQYLGSLPGNWTTTVSLLSAPWLVLPFVVGCTQTDRRRAALLGLTVTMAALAGYFLMIMSPFEGGHSSFTVHELHGLLVSNSRNIVGGLVTGPLYGWLGQRWRTKRAWTSALAVAGALCLEPAASKLAGTASSAVTAVFVVEVFVGVALAAYFVIVGRNDRRHQVPEGGHPPA